MRKRKFHLHGGQKGSAIAVRVTPRACKNEIVDLLSDGTIKIRIAAPPTNGRANKLLIEFLSEILKTPKSKIEIVAGSTSHDKLVSILDLDARSVQELILKYLFE